MNADPLPVSITGTVKAGCEADFERALHQFVRRSLLLPGRLGVRMIRPAPGSGAREYGSIRKFCDLRPAAGFTPEPSRSLFDADDGRP
jgi:antibiotic biosynthesis monooxygenase (ABM) superfamily enzyme